MTEGGASPEQPQQITKSHGEKRFIASPNQLTEVILGDLANLTEERQLDNKNVGSVLGRLRKQVEHGVSLSENGIRVTSSINKLLPADLVEATQSDVVCHNKPVPREEDSFYGKKPYYEDEKLGKVVDDRFDAYEEVLKFHQKLYDDRTNVKLVRYKGSLVVVTEHKAGDRLRIIQVLDAAYPQTKAYSEFLRSAQEGQVNPADWPIGKDRKEIDIPTRHLIVTDTVSGKSLDIRSLLSADWIVKYRPVTGLVFSQDSDRKTLTYAEISSPERLIGALHEIGHCIADANNPELFRETNDLWQETRSYGVSMTVEEYNRAKELIIRNERGASARAIQLVRMLLEKGLDLGIPIAKISEFVNMALASYEKKFPGGQSKFLRQNFGEANI